MSCSRLPLWLWPQVRAVAAQIEVKMNLQKPRPCKPTDQQTPSQGVLKTRICDLFMGKSCPLIPMRLLRTTSIRRLDSSSTARVSAGLVDVSRDRVQRHPESHLSHSLWYFLARTFLGPPGKDYDGACPDESHSHANRNVGVIFDHIAVETTTEERVNQKCRRITKIAKEEIWTSTQLVFVEE